MFVMRHPLAPPAANGERFSTEAPVMEKSLTVGPAKRRIAALVQTPDESAMTMVVLLRPEPARVMGLSM